MDWIFIAFILAGLVVSPIIAATNCPICGGGHPELEVQVNDVRVLSVQWLASQQNIDGSWPSLNTMNAILGLQLSDLSWLADQDDDTISLTTSRLEYELMTYLLPWRAECRAPVSALTLSAGRLAQYMLALQSTCISTSDFYGIDLHRVMRRFLRESDSFSNFFAYSFGILSQCSSNVTISRKALKRLRDGDSKSDPCASQFALDPSGHSIDILSLQVMAMVCARNQAIELNIRRWDLVLDARVQCIISDQLDNGSFGNNTITTALAVQALTSAEADQGSWECVDAVQWLLTRQTDGDFRGVASTAQIIPFLNCNNFGSLRLEEVECPGSAETTEERVLPVPPTIQPTDATVTFDIQVKIDDDVESYTVTTIEGENLYFGMIRLADSNSDFTFETSESAFGESLDGINGVFKDATASLYWTIRIGDLDTSAPKGIEGLEPSDGELYIFVLQDFSGN